MPTVHFLNVKQGDCSVIQHASGHVTVIDVSNASSLATLTLSSLLESYQTLEKRAAVKGNFNQKDVPRQSDPIPQRLQHFVGFSLRAYIQTWTTWMGSKRSLRLLVRQTFGIRTTRTRRTFPVGRPTTPKIGSSIRAFGMENQLLRQSVSCFTLATRDSFGVRARMERAEAMVFAYSHQLLTS